VANNLGPTTNKSNALLAATLATVASQTCTVSSDARCTTAALTAVFGTPPSLVQEGTSNSWNCWRHAFSVTLAAWRFLQSDGLRRLLDELHEGGVDFADAATRQATTRASWPPTATARTW
jgi:hypothetical protein